MRKTALTFLAFALASTAQAAPRYSVTILQMPDGTQMQGFGLNNVGDVVGGAGTTNYQAYIRHADGSYEALGGLGGNRATASTISDTGIIAGQGRTGTTSSTSTPFIRQGNGPLTAIPLPPGGSIGSVTDVNDTGTVAGGYYGPNAVGFRWTQANGFETLSDQNETTDYYIAALNNSGAAAGSIVYSDSIAFRWNVDGSVTPLEQIDAGLSSASDASDINDAGLIAGNVEWQITPGRFAGRLTLWGNDGKILRTGELAGWETYGSAAINAIGDIVGGASRTIYDSDGHFLGNESTAVLWHAGESPIDLNSLIDDPSLTLTDTLKINDRGQILAYGERNGNAVYVLLTEQAAAVPEPAMWAMLIAGFGLTGSALRRRNAVALARA